MTSFLSRALGCIASLVAAQVLHATPLGAQPPHRVTVGDATLRPDIIRAGEDTLLLVAQKNGKRLSMMTLVRRIEPTFATDRPAWRLVQEYGAPSGISRDTSVVLAQSLAPVRYSATLQDERQEYEFSPDRIRGSVRSSGGTPRAFDLPQIAPTFNAVTDDLIIASLPLRRGYVASYRSYNPGRGFTTVHVEVLADSSIISDGERVRVWVVGYDAGAAPGELWVAREAGRVIRARYWLPDGTEFWRVRPADLPLISPSP